MHQRLDDPRIQATPGRLSYCQKWASREGLGMSVPRYPYSRNGRSPVSSVMRIPPDAAIDETKFTNYLLVPRPWDDKSGYLQRAGFDVTNWSDLLAAVTDSRIPSMRSRIARTITESSTGWKECSTARLEICPSCAFG